ncbi:MAG: DNA mismatch repair endonuclease MutL [Bacteroidaceae bacterium]|nr:DNA mismatch repair endonuclease MutL [Bacteroidaceae bacterium]
MECKVRVLSQQVASQIAAGEVVNRPASVVKELVENAVDAGADSIKVILSDAGRTSIQVIDNGSGMNSEDARTAFERHATSKIKESDDLYSLTTFGFRGEALPSIAAVAEVQLRTRTADSETGTELSIKASEIESQEPCVCPVGSSFTVRNLFYNVPARRKFLKSNQTEFGHILTEMERVSIAHPEVAFELTHQGEQILSLPASAVKQRIVNLFGRKMNEALLPVEVETSVVKVSGFCSNLDNVKGKGAKQFFFVNGRFMRHPYFHKAVLSAYEGLVPESDQPSYFLFLDVPPETIDVNIHPTKTEIKFQDEQVIWKILMAAVKESVGRFEEMPTIDFNTTDMPDIPIYDASRPVTPPKVNYNPDFNPFSSTRIETGQTRTNRENWSKLYGDAIERKVNDGEIPFTPMSEMQVKSEEETLKPYQFADRFILVPSEQGLMIIDQHRAHIRVLYDRFMANAKSHVAASQGLLFPEMFQLSASDAVVFEELKPRFAALGFDLSDMGRGAIAVQGVPSGMEGQDYERLITDMIADIRINPTHEEDRQLESLALAMAYKAAIPTGRHLSENEMQELVRSLKACSIPSRTPDAKTVYIVRSVQEISRLLD